MSNCLVFAVGRLLTRGGYIVARRSRYGWWLHFFWSPDLRTFYDWAPIGRKRKRLMPPLLFRGRVRAFRVISHKSH